MNEQWTKRLAVCSWSLQPESPADLLAKLSAIGIDRVQLALDPLREKPAIWGSTTAQFASAGVKIVSGMFGCAGEDYSTLESIRATGGIAPDATWETNWRNIQAGADIARQLGIKFITFHAGFLPHEKSDPAYTKLEQRLRKVAGACQERGLHLCLETGQETAAALRQFLETLALPNVGVNFDPANMILYGKGDPIAALKTLSRWVRNVHIKDASSTKVPGTWGSEVPAGTGEVNWPAFFATLEEIGFKGDWAIEREAGNQRVEDIKTAREMVRRCLSGCVLA